jgi:DNA-binding FadR family transcriptional regulator
MFMPSLMLLQSTFARVACTQRTARDLDVLRNSVAQTCALPPGGPWDRKAAAHAEFHSLLADATGVADFALVARHISGSVQDLITWAGRPPNASSSLPATGCSATCRPTMRTARRKR